jgi:hypothetical protein
VNGQHKPVNPNALLRNGKWTIVFAQDGILLLEHYKKGMTLNTTLPPAFWTFMEPPAASVPTSGPIARFGDYLELDGYQVSREETTNLRNPDVVLTTWWKVLKPMPKRTRLVHYLTDNTGALQIYKDDQQATDWQTLDQWQSGKIYKVVSYQLTVTSAHSGNIGVDVGLTTDDTHFLDAAYGEPDQSYNQTITALPGLGGSKVVAGGKILQATQIHAQL